MYHQKLQEQLHIYKYAIKHFMKLYIVIAKQISEFDREEKSMG